MKHIWAEEYRPQRLDEYIFTSDEQEKVLRNIVTSKKIPNLLFSGVQGTGKSCAIKCIINELNVNPLDVKIINSSLKSGIDVVRHEILNFCSPLPMGDFRVLVLEEFDRFSTDAQKALRSVIEEYEDKVKFFFTCNYPNKIIPAIHSRVQHFIFDEMNEDKVVELLVKILSDQDVEVEDPATLFEHIDRYKPDIRKMINSIQQSSINGILHSPFSEKSSTDGLDKWKEIWESGSASLNECIEISKEIDEGNFESFYRIMYENIEKVENGLDKDKAIVKIAEHLYKAYTLADQDINIHSCLIQMFVDLDN